MSRIVANLLRGFGPLSVSNPPPKPTLAVVDLANGTGARATISGGDAGASNAVMVAPLPKTLGNVAWSLGTTIGGNNSGALTLANGTYLAQVQAAESGLYSLESNTVVFNVTGGGLPARTVVPAGNFPVALAGLANLVASSPTFQTWTGTSDVAHALNHVSFETDDTEESGSTRPRAIVYHAPEGWAERKVALNEYRPFLKLWLSFEAYPSNAIESESPRQDRLWDERLEFINKVQAILDDMKAAQGLGTGYQTTATTQITFSEARLIGGPDTVEDVRAEGQLGETASYFWGCVLEFDIHG
jgi:hypothetical protein